MKKVLLALCAGLMVAPVAFGASPGDVKSEYAACSKGSIAIVDEFAPHLWVGVHAPQQWAADYDKHAQATGVTDGRVTYGAPTRKEVEGNQAYVIVPTVYLYKQHGKPLVEEGQLTVVLHITGWTWTGVTPHAPR
jgi:hypothetical protein